MAVASLTLRARGEHGGGHGREGRRRPDVSPLERLLAELPPTRRRRLQQARFFNRELGTYSAQQLGCDGRQLDAQHQGPRHPHALHRRRQLCQGAACCGHASSPTRSAADVISVSLGQDMPLVGVPGSRHARLPPRRYLWRAPAGSFI